MIHITDSQTDNILGFIPEEGFWDDVHKKSLKDTLETFDFITFADRDYSEHLAKRNRIIIPDEDGKYVEFVIENTRKYRDSNGGLYIEVYTSATYIELTKAKIIKSQKTPAWAAKQHAEWALAGTEWEVGDVDFEGIRTITIEQHTNPYSFLKRLAREFDLELHFRVEEDGTKIVRRYVDLVKRVGVWQGREVEFGKDLIGIERKEDFSNIVTALIGLGPERDDGTRLEVFVEDKDALARWGRNNQHIVDVYEPESTDQTMTEARLRELTQNELEKRINSTVEYTADIADLEKVPGLEQERIRFGDTLRIKDTQFNPPLYLEARVHTQERSIKKNGYKTVTLGDYIEYTEEEVMAIWKSLKAEIAKKVSLSDVMEVTYTKTEIDDKDAGVYQDSTYYADNVSETKKQEAIQVAAEDATDKANTAEQNAKSHADTVAMNAENNAKSHADSIAEQKKQEAINAAIADADAKLSAAKTELEADIALKADAEWVNGQLVLKENTITKSNTAPASPTTGQLWLDTSVTPNVLKRWDGSAWVKATPTSAGEVGAYTRTEVDNALNSKVSVTQYNTDMNGVITRLDSAETRITQTENEIATKVSNTQYQQDKTVLENDISALETRMSNAETSITQNANQIALKANKTDVYTKTEIDGQFSTVNQQISQLDAELSVQADQIATKVSQTEFERVSSSNKVWLKFDKTQFVDFGNIGILNGKDTFSIYAEIETGSDLTEQQAYISKWNKDGVHCFLIDTVSNNLRFLLGDGGATSKTTQYPVQPKTRYTVVCVKTPTEILLYVNGILRSRTSHTVAFPVNTERFVFGGKSENGGVVNRTDGKVTNVSIWNKVLSETEIANLQNIYFDPSLYPDCLAYWKCNEGVGNVVYDHKGNLNGTANGTLLWEGMNNKATSNINTRLSTAETSITQLSNQIQLKANQTTVDTLANRISSAESTINLLSDEIDLKVNKDGVISAINVSSEGVRISGNKITIDGTTNIANGVIKTAHIGDGQITNAKIANLAVDDAKIKDLSVSKLKAGMINADQVGIGNDKVTLNSSGVTVKEADFLTQDPTSNLKSSIIPLANLLVDHSFEMLPPGSPVNSNYDIYKLDTSYFGRLGVAWFPSNESNAQILASDSGKAKFGNRAVVLRGQSYCMWDQFVDISKLTDEYFTLSAYICAYEETTSNVTPSIRLQALNSNGNWLADLSSASYTLNYTQKYKWVRIATTARKSNMPSGTAILRVRLLLNNDTSSAKALCDGVQLVLSQYPTIYQPEESLYSYLNGYSELGYMASIGGAQMSIFGPGFIGSLTTAEPITKLAHEFLTLQNGWSNYGGNFQPARYSKSADGWVHLSGLVRNGTIGSALATLPAGCRPRNVEIFRVASAGATNGLIYVYPDGRVVPIDGHKDWITLSGVIFLGEN